ncbi:MAG: CBS domain-containing protein [Kiritimatiellia bacterium]
MGGSPALPIPPDQSPLVLLDLLFKMRIRDVMTTTLLTVARGDSLRHAQSLMKANSITGLPVAEEGRLFGIVSMDDIVSALEGGWIEESVEKHMTRNVVVLEEDMPLSFGASYFDKYRFGRFPVLNRDNRLVGILSSRDVSAAVLIELLQEFVRLEARLPAAQPPPASESSPGKSLLHFSVKTYDFERAGRASHEIKRTLTGLGIDPRLIRRASVASYEMEINMVLHSAGGSLACAIDPDRVELTASDTGPGIPNVEQALEEGYTTANEWIKSLGFGAGMGLANIRRVSDDFSIQSSLVSGTTVKAAIRLTPPAPVPPHHPT